MANITAADVNKLRQMTGAGIMDCKQALVESDGDFDKAIEYLRKKGQKLASKRADRSANEGIVWAKTNNDNTYAAMLMLNCETDFVGKNQDFVDFAKNIIDVAIDKKSKNLDEVKSLKIDNHTIEDLIIDMVGKIGEKIDLAHFEIIEAPAVYAYNHHGNRLATILGLDKADVAFIDQIGKEVAMHIAAMAPIALDKDAIDPQIIEKEIEIGKEQARAEGKPEEILEKIATGKLNKFFKENTLVNQDFVRDSSKTVGQYLQDADKELKVVAFKRLMLGA